MLKKIKNKWIRRTFYILLGFVTFLVITIGVILFLYSQTTVLERAAVDFLNRQLADKGTVKYKSIRGSLLNHIEIQDLDISLQDQAQINCNYLEVHYDLWRLLYNEIKVSKILIDKLDVEIFSQSSEKKESDHDKKPISVDTTLIKIEESNFIDNLLDRLPIIQVSDINITATSVNLISQDIKFSDIDLLIDRVYINKKNYVIKLDQLSGQWDDRAIMVLNTSFELTGDRNYVTLNRFEIETEKSKFACSAYYGLRDSINADVDFYELYVDLDEVARISGVGKLHGGFIEGRWDFSGEPTNFIFNLNLSGRWQDRILHKLDANMDYNDGLIKVNRFVVRSNAGQINVNGQGRENQGAFGKIRLYNLNLNKIIPDLIQTNLNGLFDFDFEALHLTRPTGKGSLTLYQSEIDSIAFDSLRFALRVKSGNWQIDRPSYIQFSDSSRFELEGSLSRKKEIDITFSSYNNDLLTLGQAFHQDSLFGQFDLQMRAMGSLDDPNVSGVILFPYFRADSIEFKNISLEMYIEKILSERKGELKFEIDSGSVASVPMNELKIMAHSLRNQINFERIQLYNRENYVNASAKINFYEDSIRLSITDFKAEYEKYWLKNLNPIDVLYDSTGITIKNLNFEGPKYSKLNINGKWLSDIGDFKANLVLDGIQIEPFQQFIGEDHKVSGIINGKAEINTPLTNPDLNLDISASELTYNDIYIGNLNSTYQFHDSVLYMKELTLERGELKFTAGGNFGFTLSKKGLESFDFVEGTLADFKINWENISLEQFNPLFKLKNKLKGELSGYLEVAGTINRPRLRQHLEMYNFEYGDYKVDSLSMFGQYNSGYIILDSLSAVFNETGFSLKGWQQYDLNLANIDTSILDNPFNFYLHSRDNKIGFLGLFNEQIESINGAYDMELYIGGTPEAPAITAGYVKMSDGEILLSRILDPIRDVNIDIAVEDSVMQINKFRGYSVEEKDFLEKSWRLVKALIPWSGRKVDDGRLNVKGSIGLHDVTKPDLDLDITMDELYINYFIENTKLLLTTESIKIIGQDTIAITGGIYIPKAEYEVDLTMMEKNVYLYETSVEPAKPPYIDLNLDIQIPGGFNITSSPLDLTNNFKIGIIGDLRVIMEPGSDLTQITGHLDVASGNYSSWNQNFDVQSGSIDFINPLVINPDINIVAIKQLRNYTFEMIISGNLESITQELIVKNKDGKVEEMSPADKIAMLTLGTNVQELAANTDSTIINVGSQVATTSLLTAVERSAEQYTGLDRVEISSSDNILDLNKMRLNNGLKEASISFGKYLTTDLYVEYRTRFNENIPAPSLSWDAGNRLGLQYRINKHWSLDSYYEKTIQGNNKVQLGINWEYSF